MMDDFYRDEILDHYDSSPYRGPLEAPDCAASLENPICGDCVSIEVAIDHETSRINQIRFDGKGCVISQAAASILAENVERLSLADASSLTADQMIDWLGISLTPARRKCGLLALRTLHRALAVFHSASPSAT